LLADKQLNDMQRPLQPVTASGRLPGVAARLTLIHKLGMTVAVPESSRTNADDRLPIDPLGRVEGSDGIVEGRDLADVRPQPSVPHPLDNLTQLGAGPANPRRKPGAGLEDR